jgi:hypothetical protein
MGGTMTGQSASLFALSLLSLGACKVVDPLYCDETKPCTDPERPFCDLEGEHPASDGVARTCIANPTDAGAIESCTPTEFLGCDSESQAAFCNEEGTARVAKDCNAVCSEEGGGCECECPEGPPGPGFGECVWHYTKCDSEPGDQCQQVCPAGTFVAAGGCDADSGATVQESRPAPPPGGFPPSPIPFNGMDRWVCQSASGVMTFSFALCCSP